ncbi:hypothetical protein C8R44DRAFT_873535 [Mycena epipterygia]|nr:hypothetical protein C8R44DRAFT_873535 [Mycena epipterygia]
MSTMCPSVTPILLHEKVVMSSARAQRPNLAHDLYSKPLPVFHSSLRSLSNICSIQSPSFHTTPSPGSTRPPESQTISNLRINLHCLTAGEAGCPNADRDSGADAYVGEQASRSRPRQTLPGGNPAALGRRRRSTSTPSARGAHRSQLASFSRLHTELPAAAAAPVWAADAEATARTLQLECQSEWQKNLLVVAEDPALAVRDKFTPICSECCAHNGPIPAVMWADDTSPPLLSVPLFLLCAFHSFCPVLHTIAFFVLSPSPMLAPFPIGPVHVCLSTSPRATRLDFPHTSVSSSVYLRPHSSFRVVLSSLPDFRASSLSVLAPRASSFVSFPLPTFYFAPRCIPRVLSS